MGVFDMFTLKIVSPLWRNDLLYHTQVKLFRHWRCGEWLALPLQQQEIFYDGYYYRYFFTIDIVWTDNKLFAQIVFEELMKHNAHQYANLV